MYPVRAPHAIATICVRRPSRALHPSSRLPSSGEVPYRFFRPIEIDERNTLMLDKTEQMKSLSMTGVDHEDVTTNPLSLCYPSRAPISERRAEPLRDRLHGPACRVSLPSPGFGAPLHSALDSATGRYISTSAGRKEKPGGERFRSSSAKMAAMR